MRQRKLLFFLLLIDLTIAGCASQAVQEDDKAVAEATQTENTDREESKQHHEIQVERYASLNPVPRRDEKELLKVIVTIHFPSDIQTVGEGLRYLLKRSGYRLADYDAQGPKVVSFFGNPLPIVHRNLGPMALDDALKTLMTPSFRLIVDPVHRQVGFELKPEYCVTLGPAGAFP